MSLVGRGSSEHDHNHSLKNGAPWGAWSGERWRLERFPGGACGLRGTTWRPPRAFSLLGQPFALPQAPQLCYTAPALSLASPAHAPTLVAALARRSNLCPGVNWGTHKNPMSLALSCLLGKAAVWPKRGQEPPEDAVQEEKQQGL